MLLETWFHLIERPVDLAGAVLFLLLFPVYHAAYPLLMRWFPRRAVKVRIDELRRSWVAGLVERRDFVTAAQQTRNLTMVNSLLGSSALILMGVTANMLLRLPELEKTAPAEAWTTEPETLGLKLLLLVVVFGVAFGYCMASLRHLGHFNMVIGADPEVIGATEGEAVEYLSDLVSRASNRYTLAVRCFYSASPIFLWLFDPWLFVAMTAFWGLKFVGRQDFARRGRASER